MKIEIATSREQSERLLKCGVDPKTADMVWTTFDNDGEKSTKLDVMDEYAYEFASLHPIPAWSLSALLALLPKEIYSHDDNVLYYPSLTRDYPFKPDYALAYRNAWVNDEEELFRTHSESPIEACVKAVEWFKSKDYEFETESL